jgi:hypothetical protein
LFLKSLKENIGIIPEVTVATAYSHKHQREIPVTRSYYLFDSLIPQFDNFTENWNWERLSKIESQSLNSSPNCINRIKKIRENIFEQGESIPETRLSEIENYVETYCGKLSAYKTISMVRRELKILFNELVNGINLHGSLIIQKLLDFYNAERREKGYLRSQIKVSVNDFISEIPQLDEEDFLLPNNKEHGCPFVDDWGDIYKYFIICFAIESLKSIKFRAYLRKCQRCEIFFIAKKNDKRIKYCNNCSAKSSLTGKDRALYQREYRERKKQEKLANDREAKIENYMKHGWSRKEAEEIIETDSKL